MIKIEEDVAEIEFNRFTEAMDLDFDTESMDSSDLTQFRRRKKLLIREIMFGSLVVNENGEFVYTPKNKRSKYQESITFYERDGAALMAMDGKKTGYEVAKMYAVLSAMCKVPPKTFASLVGVDIRVSEAIFVLLMA